jgi:sigma-B regulation protein RsbU (phosphoserine phosphatase)
VWRSARQVGGDFYDFVPLASEPEAAGPGSGRTGVVIADVADKGVPAALFMALSRTLVRTAAISGRSPGWTIARANDLIVSDARSDLFVTLFYAIVEPDVGEITFVNAGHMPPILVRADSGPTEELRTGGMAMGVLPGVEYEQSAVRLDPEDVLVFYTDGVIEALNANQQVFGKERLIEVVRNHRSRSATELARVVDDTIEAFVGDTSQFDDFTLVVAKRKIPELPGPD